MRKMTLLAGLALALTFFNFSCQNDPNDPVDPNNPSSYLAIFSCDLDGTNFEMIATTSGAITTNVGTSKSINSQVSPVETTASYRSFLFDNNTNESAGLEVGQITYTGSSPDYNLWRNFFQVASSNFAMNAQNGWEVSMTINGVHWSTSNGSGDQTGSNIQITEMTESTVAGIQIITIKANFNCTVYDPNGNSKTLTNGLYEGYFEYE